MADDLVVIGKVVQNIVNLRGPSPVHVNSRVTRDLPVSYDSNLFYTRLTPLKIDVHLVYIFDQVNHLCFTASCWCFGKMMT